MMTILWILHISETPSVLRPCASGAGTIDVYKATINGSCVLNASKMG